jgi:hypothetical protein
MVARTVEGRHNGASQAVMTYLRQHCNIAVPYPEIQKAIGAEQKFTVPNAITHLIAKGMPIERPMTGFAIYRTLPKAVEAEPVPEPEPEVPTQKLYKYVGNSDKVVIVRGEDMELYVVLPLTKFMGMDD